MLKPPANYQENSLKNINNQIPINDANQKPKFKIINELNEAKNNKSNYKSTKNNNSKQLIVKTIKYNEEKKANINNQISNKISDTQNSKLISNTKFKNDSDSKDARIDNASANLANDDRSEKSALIATSSENVKVQPKKFIIGILPDNQ